MLSNPFSADIPYHKEQYRHLPAERGGFTQANDFRLGASALFVPTSNTSSSSTLYYSPRHISIDGTAAGYITVIHPNGQPVTILAKPVSLSVVGVVSGSNYDVFAVYASPTSITIELGSAWSSNTTRNTPLSVYMGRLVKSVDPRRLYVGTIRAANNDVIADTYGGVNAPAQRFVFNFYNQVPLSFNPYYSSFITITGDGAWHNVSLVHVNVRAEFVFGMPSTVMVESRSQYIWVNSASSQILYGFGFNGSSPDNDQQHLDQNLSNCGVPASGGFSGRVVGQGYYYADPWYQVTNGVTGFVGNPGLSAVAWM